MSFHPGKQHFGQHGSRAVGIPGIEDPRHKTGLWMPHGKLPRPQKNQESADAFPSDDSCAIHLNNMWQWAESSQDILVKMLEVYANEVEMFNLS